MSCPWNQRFKSQGCSPPAFARVSCVRRWQSGTNEGNFFNFRSVRTWRILTPNSNSGVWFVREHICAARTCLYCSAGSYAIVYQKKDVSFVDQDWQLIMAAPPPPTHAHLFHVAVWRRLWNIWRFKLPAAGQSGRRPHNPEQWQPVSIKTFFMN